MIEPIKQTTIYDHNAIYYGYPMERLMENAGQGVAEILEKKYGKNKKIAFICGPGNNGGDGLVAARYLQKSHKPTVFLVPEKTKSELTRKNWDKFTGEKHTGVKAGDIPDDFDIVVECLFGTGISGKLKEPYASVVKRINKLKGKKVSVDLPTPGFKEDLIISLMTQKDPGAITVDIGYPDWLKKKIGTGEVKALNRPGEKSHKGQNGQVLIVAGNEKYHGALLLAARTAGQIADLVFVSSIPENLEIVKKMKPKLPEFIAVEEQEIPAYSQKADAILLGPGLGTGEDIRPRVNRVVSRNKKKKVVLDADALKTIDKKFLHKNCLLTPHAGEFQELFEIKPTEKNIKKMAQKYGCTILLKGNKDIISDGEEVKINETGNPGMTKGGTGDVLAGLATGLASRNDLFLSACAAAFINGLAGDRLQQRKSYYYSASELVREIPKVIKEVNSN